MLTLNLGIKLSILENSSSGAFGTYADVAAVITSPLRH